MAERVLLGATAGGAAGASPAPSSSKQRYASGAATGAEAVLTLYVGNLPFNTTEQSLKAALVGAAVSTSTEPQGCGQLPSLTEAGIADLRLVHDKVTQKFRGFAFVQCSTHDAQRRLLAMDGARKFGRALRVRCANPTVTCT